MSTVVLAAVQFSRRLGDRAHNLDLAREHVRAAHGRGARLIALPELFSTGYFPGAPISDEYFGWAEPVDGPTIRSIGELATELDCFVVAPIYEVDTVSRVYYNTAVLVGPDGVVGIHRKRHVGSIIGLYERHYFAPGNLQYPVYQLPFGRVGMSICYDRQFPETFRHLALRGAEIVVSVNNVGSARRLGMWRTEAQSGAGSNGIFVLTSNATVEAEGEFFGRSMLTDPFGELVAESDGEPGVLVAPADLGVIEAARMHYGFIRDTRLEDLGLTDESLLETRMSRLGFI
ncbi:MAG TPA: carbon-nitrogen hydrolase family protein [Pseudonocardiaceae bacterium]|nr:carbon-nitrogen hydrolase family protein [Pseudonocardiaceae bacterium]